MERINRGYVGVAMRVLFIVFLIFLSRAVHAIDGMSSEPSSHERGRAIYNYYCYFCHGYSGDAKTLAATYLNPPPRNFTEVSFSSLGRAQMVQVVTNGKPDTAMPPFERRLSKQQISLVVDFVRREFMAEQAENTRYHTMANGWPEHDRYRSAYPFVLGTLPINRESHKLSAVEKRGRELFFGSCISCHDGVVEGKYGPVWESDAVSYPRTGFQTGDFLLAPDQVSGASSFALHDIPPPLAADLTAQEQEGRTLFLENCAFCHAADGTGKNWIGTFLKPHPRDLTRLQGFDHKQLARVIREGVVGTSMPAWGSVLTPGQVEALVSYLVRSVIPADDDK